MSPWGSTSAEWSWALTPTRIMITAIYRPRQGYIIPATGTTRPRRRSIIGIIIGSATLLATTTVLITGEMDTDTGNRLR